MRMSFSYSKMVMFSPTSSTPPKGITLRVEAPVWGCWILRPRSILWTKAAVSDWPGSAFRRCGRCCRFVIIDNTNSAFGDIPKRGAGKDCRAKINNNSQVFFVPTQRPAYRLQTEQLTNFNLQYSRFTG